MSTTAFLLVLAAAVAHAAWNILAHGVSRLGLPFIEVPLYTAALGRRLPRVVAVMRDHWRRLIGFGILSPLAYILVLTAIQTAPVALVAPIREVSVIMVSLYGAFVLREAQPALRLGASAVVVAGIVMLAV